MRRVALGVLAIALAAAAAAAVAEREDDRQAFERRVTAELGERAPDAVPLLEKAEATRMSGDVAAARDLYAELLERAPGFSHAQRRLCGLESALENHQRAIELCRAAVEQSATVENLSALAFALQASGANAAAWEQARRATYLDPESTTANEALCAVSLQRDDIATLRRCSERLIARAPNQISGHFYAALAAGSDEDWDAARAHLERARELGLPDALYNEINAKIDELEPLWPTVLELALLAVGIWLGVMLLMAVIGSVLSNMTMRTADRLTSRDAAEAGAGGGSTLRRVYRGLLVLSCVIYYASLPLLLAIIVLTGGGLLYAFWAAGYVPIKLAGIIAIVTGVTGFAVIRSIFSRARDSDPGERLDLDEHPRLRALLDEVADKIGTRPVDNVYLTPGTDIAVTERGAMFQQLRGDSERCLILGAGVLEGMPLPAFRAVLAHEYGHFSNRDTAGGGLALAVRRSLLMIGINIARSGSAAWYNPGWLFFRVFFRVFQGISQGASRLQEIMADRWAVQAYGAANFEDGLRHVIRRSISFDQHVNNTVEEAVEQRVALFNVYRYEPAAEIDEDEVDEAVEAAIDEAPSAYDSHPRPADRFRWAHAMQVAEPEPGDGDDLDAWSLFEHRDRLEEQMTGELRDRILEGYGVDISDPDDDFDDEEE